MKRSLLNLCFLCAFCGSPLPSFSADPPYTDPFTSESHEARRATRGPWLFENGVASCTQDDALYEKFANHGPVTWFDLDFTDATVKFSIMPDADVKSFVFTLNGDNGHVFRFVTGTNQTLIKAFAREGKNDPEENLDREGPPLKAGEWTDITVTLKGENAVVKIGDYEKAVTHPAIAQPKIVVGLGFAFGTMKFKSFSIN